MHANCRYAASDTITTFAIFGTNDPKRVEVDFVALIKEIYEIATAFIDVVSAYLFALMIKVIEKNKLQSQSITMDVPSLNELRLHYYVAKSNSKKLYT